MPIPGSVQGWDDWSSEQSDLLEGVPPCGRGSGNKMTFKVPFNPYHSMILC